MNTKNKLNRLSFLKNQMMNSGVNEIEDIEVTRDIRGVDNWQSLKGFMQTIRENGFAVLLISDSYL